MNSLSIFISIEFEWFIVNGFVSILLVWFCLLFIFNFVYNWDYILCWCFCVLNIF